MASVSCERAWAFFAGLIVCSILSSSLTVVIREHDPFLSDNPPKSSVPLFPHSTRAQTPPTPLGFWSWFPFNRAEMANVNNMNGAGTDVRVASRSSHPEAFAVVQKAEVSAQPPGDSSNFAVTPQNAEKKVAASSSWFWSRPFWARFWGENGYPSAEKAATNLVAGEVKRTAENSGTQQKPSKWSWGWSTSGEVRDGLDKLTPEATRPVSTSAAGFIDTGANSFELHPSKAEHGVPAGDQNEDAGPLASREVNGSTIQVSRSDGEDEGRFGWVWRYIKSRRGVGQEGKSERRQAEEEVVEASTTAHGKEDIAMTERLAGHEAEESAVREVGAQASGLSAGAGSGPEGQAHAPGSFGRMRVHERGRGEKAFMGILGCMAGLVVCAVVAVGSVRLVRMRGGAGEELPLLERDVADGDGILQSGPVRQG